VPRHIAGASRRRAVIAVVTAAAVVMLAGVGYRTIGHHHHQPGEWGGFQNGRIPSDQLCGLTGQPDHRLRCDAAAAYARMAAAYSARFKTHLCITDSYRSYDQQVEAHAAKPDITAEPGTSNHGWGLAVDLCGGVNSFDTRQHLWVVASGPAFGWFHPSWAAKGKPRAEPWHFEFGRL
jgi:LAS superfamily LD-carboxypeptidase LdcB